MELNFWAASDVGKKRDHNEDDFLIDSQLSLFAVADGMGGHASGEVASHLALHEFRNTVEAHKTTLAAFLETRSAKAKQDVLTLLESAVHTACASVFDRGKAEPDKRGMGTTVSALVVVGERGFVAHVGDSRIYLLRQGQVVQLTEDHSLINELIRRGKVTREGLAQSPYNAYKNAVTRAVGVYETVQVDTIDFEVLAGDRFLLCSDGLHAYLDDEKVKSLLGEMSVVSSPAALVDLANEQGGMDNITAITLAVEEPATQANGDRAEELNRKIEILKQMPLFKHLTYKEIIRILNLAEVSDFGAGQDLIREGESGDELYILLKGQIKLHKDGAFITTMLPGAHLGEMALIDSSARSVSATADEPSRVLILRRREFYEIIRKDSALSVKLLWSLVQVLADRLRKTTADLSDARQEPQHEPLPTTDNVLFDE